METNETLEPLNPQPGIILNFEAQTYLKEAGKWANFLGILGFIVCALFLLGSFRMGSTFSTLSELSPNPVYSMMAAAGGVFTVIFILIDVLYFFFSLYLFQFGSNIKKGIMFSDSAGVTVALGKLKSFFKLWGITTIVVLCIYALAIIGIIVAGIGAASMMHH